MANIIVEWHPERKERILLCTHYDTRPQPDNDPDPAQRRTGTFIGANDGASGVAIFMELAHLMPKSQDRWASTFRRSMARSSSTSNGAIHTAWVRLGLLEST